MLQALFANVTVQFMELNIPQFPKSKRCNPKNFGRPRQMIVKVNEIGHEGVCFKFPY
jgi:hypothetical protein